ncbi:MAG TPA: GMC family oxidoreductase [Gemmatimonadaceae bacterium]|nr:GMC family oxidoreductase [Gemmatimonadaceae bacterium]
MGIGAVDDYNRCGSHALLRDNALDSAANQSTSLRERPGGYDYGDRALVCHSAEDLTVELDALTLPDGVQFDADVCIVGAGPAGLALACELARLDATVIILESGGLTPDRDAQELNEGDTLGDAYAGLRATRNRRVGGSTTLWNTPFGNGVGAKYMPLDAWDFEEWPFDLSHVLPFYHRAQVVCGLGTFAYDADAWGDESRPLLNLPRDLLATRVYQLGCESAFSQGSMEPLRGRNIRLCRHATAVELTMDGARAVRAVHASNPRGNHIRVTPKFVVLAGGAIENARLLLVSGSGERSALGNGSDWVGRGFMEHPRDYSLRLIPRSGDLFRNAAFYDFHAARDGTIVGGRIALEEHAIRTKRIPNASVTLLPRLRKLPALARRLTGRGPDGGYGWSRVRRPNLVFDGFRLVVNIEQRPNAENRVVLSRVKDALGVPRPALHWRWCDEEQAGLDRLRECLASWLEEAEVGRLVITPGTRPDPNAHHHAGTTRMHVSPQHGVVDANARVHGVENLYIAGASVFPTAGVANPTLTIVALSLRLADHLGQRL